MRLKIALVTFLALASVCLLLADVKTDYDHKADFAKYHTYSWIKVKTEDPLWVDRIKSAVDSQLVAKGWQQVPEGGDTDVAAYGSTHHVETLQTWYNGVGGGWRWRGFNNGMSTTTVQKTPVGTLMVDVFDGNNKQLIWRGVSSDTLAGNPDKNIKKLNKNVESMFKKFPPSSKG